MGSRRVTGIALWPEDDRPREKLTRKGPSVLSDAELLAILIGSGTPERSALELAREVTKLADNNLTQLGKLPIKELQRVKGIGKARSVVLAAAMELGRRRRLTEAIQRKKIAGYKEALEILFPLLQDLPYECFCVLYLDAAQQLICHEIISNGGLTATIADIRVIIKNALSYDASRLIVAHNHPSGSTKPSDEDIRLTTKIKTACTTMDIRLVDHFIIAGTKHTSFAGEGFL